MSDKFSTSGNNKQAQLVTSDTFGERLRHFRKKCGLVQEDFGVSLGVSLATITRLERDKVQAQGDFLVKLIEIYNCDLRWLLTGENQTEEVPNEVIRNERIYSMLQAQRGDWAKIVECTMNSVAESAADQKQEAEKSIQEERAGLAYLDALLIVGQGPE